MFYFTFRYVRAAPSAFHAFGQAARAPLVIPRTATCRGFYNDIH
jgi:hypothetical protein